MPLVVLENGRLRQAIADNLAQVGQGGLSLESPTSEDLFSRALGHTAIIYGPAACLLEARLEPSPDVERMRKVLRAANAPGIALLVVVIPEGDGYQVEIDALRRDGKPYMVVRAPALIEEVADVIASDDDKSLWLPNQGALRAAPAVDVARAVAHALVAENQGCTTDVEADASPAPMVFRRAAEVCGKKVRVHRVTPWIFRLLRPLYRWLRGREPRAFALLDRLFSRPDAPRALPAAG